MVAKKKFKYQFNSDIRALNNHIDEIIKVLKNWVFDEKEIYYLELIIVELLNNAIIHGNNNDPLKKVFVNMELVDNMIKIEVIDEGDIFELNIPNYVSPLSDCGRGLYLVSKLVDNINILKDKAKKVVVYKKIKKGKSRSEPISPTCFCL
ncbi:ATP-binding protein [Deferribacter thermophilus]|uniref:ATP-binding protein n=1 Tax=Deferribacter thermophilus TaxID=53573 RepID=UPI003C2A2022